MDGAVFVYIDLAGAPVLVGRLWSRVRNGRESASFEYDQDWLENPQRFALEPALTLTPGPFHTPSERKLFGAFGDSAPDRWGREIMSRNESLRAGRKGETPRTLFESDFLLFVVDEARQGALRFKTDLERAFLTTGGQPRIPPLVDLQRLFSMVSIGVQKRPGTSLEECRGALWVGLQTLHLVVPSPGTQAFSG